MIITTYTHKAARRLTKVNSKAISIVNGVMESQSSSGRVYARYNGKIQNHFDFVTQDANKLVKVLPSDFDVIVRQQDDAIEFNSGMGGVYSIKNHVSTHERIEPPLLNRKPDITFTLNEELVNTILKSSKVIRKRASVVFSVKNSAFKITTQSEDASLAIDIIESPTDYKNFAFGVKMADLKRIAVDNYKVSLLASGTMRLDSDLCTYLIEMSFDYPTPRENSKYKNSIDPVVFLARDFSNYGFKKGIDRQQRIEAKRIADNERELRRVARVQKQALKKEQTRFNAQKALSHYQPIKPLSYNGGISARRINS